MITKIALIDPGHGGMIGGKYVTAPDKMFHHKGHPLELHGDGYFYEGVWNRVMALKVGSILQERKIPYLYTIPFQYWNEDVSLKARVRFANTIHDPFNRIFCGFFSIHANSHDGTARGFEVYTSIGETESDYIAQVHYKNVDQRLGGRIRMRPGDKPGEVDKERKFYVLHRTKMPAVLIEHLYFDNFDDVCLLVDPEVIREFAEALADSIESWMKGSFYL